MDLKSLTVQQILNIEGFPRRLIVAFAAACAFNADHDRIHFILDAEHYKPLLINMMRVRLTKVEKALILGGVEDI